MAFVVTKLSALLLYPLSLSLLLAVIAAVFLRLRWRRTGYGMLCLAWGWLYLCSTALFADFLMSVLEEDYPPRAMSAIPAVDAIVLLGGGTRGDTHMGVLADLNEHGDRLIHATGLYKAGKAPVILASGGAPRGGRPEAEQMRDILRVMGVPRSAIVLEPFSRNTHENAVYSAQLLRQRELRRVLLVTSAFHMRRAMGVFRAQGVEAIPAPTDFKRVVAEGVVPSWLPGVGNLSRSTQALHEMFGYQVYRWRGWL